MKPLLILNIVMLFFLKTAFSQYPNISLIDAELLASKKNDFLKGDAQVVKQVF